jgi:hypothetical protein
MPRPKLVLISKSAGVCGCFSWLLHLLSPELIGHYEIELVTYCSGSELFDKVEAIEPQRLRDAFIIVCDLSDVDLIPWSVRHLGMSETGLAAALLLSFPEPYFVFVGCRPPELSASTEGPSSIKLAPVLWHHFVSWPQLIRLVELLRVHNAGFRTVFDPTGIRTWLKSILLGEDAQSKPLGSVYYERTRDRLQQSAVAADEESSFLYLNGYGSYKAGFRTWLINSDSEFNRILPATGRHPSCKVPQMKMILSDWDLAFADHEGDSRPNYLMGRAEISDDQKLVLITSFAGRVEAFVQSLRKGRKTSSNGSTAADVLVVPKPYPGIYSLLRQIGAKEKEPNQEGNQTATLSQEMDSDNHSLPFARRIVVERLIKRATRLGGNKPACVEDAIHVALLALEAKEVLGALSLTTYYEALALQHEAEVSAEVSCFGTAAQLDAEIRLEHLRDETQAVVNFQSARGDDATSIENSRLNFLVRLSNRLRSCFGDNEQIGAAEQCLQFFAQHKDKLARRQGHNKLSLIASRYVDLVTGHGNKISKLLLVNVGVIAVFGLIYMLVIGAAIHTISSSHSQIDIQWIQQRLPAYAFGHSAFTFLELQPGLTEVDNFLAGNHLGAAIVAPYRILLGSQELIAYVHLGLLISMLYRKLTRHAP